MSLAKLRGFKIGLTQMEVSFKNALNLWTILGGLVGFFFAILGGDFFYAVDTFQSNLNSQDLCN